MNTVSRLIDFFVPEHYDLSLTLDRVGRRFEGSVTIKGRATGKNHIKLHAKDLVITEASIDYLPAKYELGDNDELTLDAGDIGTGDRLVTLAFKGKIEDQMHGLYPCYFEHDGVKKELLATQFESHHAREVFPSIDEPAAKATFALTLTTEPDQTVLSNMPVKEQSAKDGQMVTTFDTSPRMSTYLLAFVVGELQRKTATTKSGVEVNVYATNAQPAAALDYPLDMSVRLIEFFDNYYGTPYPLPKCDHVALPDFSAGAMENWGLITYREVALMADPQTTGISTQQYVATVIAHELSHQWFGNLVTMAWWNDLWLNESFAELMMHLAVDALEPDWNIWLEFASSISVSALRRDAIDGVQAVQVDVHHPDQISTLFDPAIVYAKGAQLLRMLEHYIGEDAFRTGLQRYFADYAYKNTIGDDLWEALAAASGKQVATIMNAWITQPGYPVVTLTRGDDGVTLSQQRFFIGQHEDSDATWPIPLDASETSGAPTLMNTPQITIPAKVPVRLNQQDTAHFITNYDDISRQQLIDQVADGTLDTIGRIQLLNEAILLARGGVMSTDKLLPLLEAYGNESHEPVWVVISMALAELRKFVEDDPDAEKQLRHLSANVARKQYDRLGWDAKANESADDTKLRATIIGLTLYGEVPDALAKAKELYETTPLDDMDPELRALVLSSVSRYSDSKVVDDLLAIYKKSPSAEVKQDICIGITSTRDPQKIAELLEAVKNQKIVKAQDVFRWFIYLIRGKESREATWQWIQDNWDWAEKTFKGDKSYDDFPRYSATALSTRKQLEEYQAFFTPLVKVPALARAITMGISEIEGRVELIEKDKDAVIRELLALKLG
jgi:aminopeptidase N